MLPKREEGCSTEFGADDGGHHVLRPRVRRDRGERCTYGGEEKFVRGLRVISDEIVEATRRNKRKIHAEYVASAEDKEKAMRDLVAAQDKVVTLKAKHGELLRHHRRAQKNYFKVAHIRETTTIELASAISACAEQGTVKKLRPLAAVSGAVLTSTTMELERLNTKVRILH